MPKLVRGANCPQPEAEERIRSRLKDLDELLDIRWFPIGKTVELPNGDIQVDGRYALVCRWPQGDLRWKMFYSGEVQEPFDVMAWFCEDLQSADSTPGNIDLMEDQVVEFLGKCDNTRQPWAERMMQSVEHNLKVKRDLRAEILDLAHDEFSYAQKKIAGESIIPVTGLVTEPKPQSTKPNLIIVKE